jgi:hypothetical protein
MRADISSRTTFVYKFVFPAIWIPLFGFVAYLALSSGQRGTGDRTVGIVMVTAWLVVSAFLLRLVISLRRVQLRDGRLYASNYRREIEIAPSEIERITQNVWINVRPVTLHLRHETSIGRRIRFLPPSRVRFNFWKEDPIVDQLRRLAGLLPPIN